MTTDQDSTRAPLVKYKLVDGHPEYRVGDDGSVWSRKKAGRWGGMVATWTLLKPSPATKYGHLMVALRRGAVRRYVHRMVLEAFVGPCPEGKECLHGDGDPTNNRLDNLKWGTKQENADDKIRHGRSCRGEDSPHAILDEPRVLRIVARAAAGDHPRAIAADFNVEPGVIRAILRGGSWCHLTGLPKYVPKTTRPAGDCKSSREKRQASGRNPAEQRQMFDEVRVLLEANRECAPLPDRKV